MKQLKQPSPTSLVEASFHLLLLPSHLPSLTSVCLSCQHCPHASLTAGPCSPFTGSQKLFLPLHPAASWPHQEGPTVTLATTDSPPFLGSPCIPLTARPTSHRLPPGVSGRKESSQTLNLNPHPSHLPSAKQASQRLSKINK